jgi:hypothetical protein
LSNYFYCLYYKYKLYKRYNNKIPRNCYNIINRDKDNYLSDSKHSNNCRQKGIFKGVRRLKVSEINTFNKSELLVKFYVKRLIYLANKYSAKSVLATLLLYIKGKAII